MRLDLTTPIVSSQVSISILQLIFSTKIHWHTSMTQMLSTFFFYLRWGTVSFGLTGIKHQLLINSWCTFVIQLCCPIELWVLVNFLVLHYLLVCALFCVRNWSMKMMVIMRMKNFSFTHQVMTELNYIV